MLKEESIDYEAIIAFMKFGYGVFGIIPFHLIDTLTDYLITINVEQDKEFKLLLGEGYYK